MPLADVLLPLAQWMDFFGGDKGWHSLLGLDHL
jgi:hypothetical protein